jgi:hypothetical protein
MSDARAWTTVALFGALWGAAEVTIGLLLKAAGVPFYGLLLASIGVMCMVTARRLRPAPGSTLIMGLVVALLKVFSAGGLALGSVLGILLEAAALEIAFTATGSSAVGAVLGGGVALASAPAQHFAWIFVIAGPQAAEALQRTVHRIGTFAGLGSFSLWGLLALPVLVAGLAGLIVGAFAWRTAGRVRRRLRGGP